MVGLLKDGHLDASMKTIKTHSSSINGKGFAYNYNVEQISDYVLEEESTVVIKVVNGTVEFYVNDVKVGTSVLEDVQYRFAIWQFYTCVELTVYSLHFGKPEESVEEQKGDSDLKSFEGEDVSINGNLVTFEGKIGTAW